MTRDTADAFWGPDAVDHALRYEEHDPITAELAREVSRRARALPAGAFRAWTLTQPWPKFCAIVRVVSGKALHDELDDSGAVCERRALSYSRARRSSADSCPCTTTSCPTRTR